MPLRDNQFQSLTWGTEVLYSDNRYHVDPDGIPGNAGCPVRTVGSLGPVFLCDLQVAPAVERRASCSIGCRTRRTSTHETFAYSPYLTWALSHWNQLRLQYTHTDHNAETPACDPTTPFICNGPGSSARTRMAGKQR